MRAKRIGVIVVVGLLLSLAVLPQSALADGLAILHESVAVSDVTSISASVTWTTSTASDGQVNYGITSALGGTASGSSNVTHHFVPLAGLSPDRTYYFEVRSGSLRSPANTSEYYSFKTLPVATYNITLESICGSCGEGVCGEVIEVTALVVAAGTYHICWDTPASGSVKATFKADGPGSHTAEFFLPETTKGIHRVYLTDSTYVERAHEEFEVLPSVKISPEEGPEGTAVRLNGYGFAASQGIQIKFRGAVVATPTANSVGSWNATYAILAAPGGGHTFDIEAMEGTVWVNWASKYFKVTPQITGPATGKVGQKIEIEGTGFGSRETNIKITLGGDVVQEVPYAEEDGSWTATVAIPPVQRGTYAIDASGSSTRARDVEEIEFIVTAGISVEPVSSYVGDTIVVEGGGFAREETGVQVYFDGVVIPSTIRVGSDGCWESSFTVPTSAYGPHSVSASGDITKTAAEATFSTRARILQVTPDYGAPGDPVSLAGDGFGSAQPLAMSIGGVAASESKATSSNGNVVASFHVPKGSIEGRTQLVISDGSGASASWNFTVTSKTLSVIPLPISPKGSRLRSGAVAFRWQGMPSGGDITYTYTLEISQAAGSAPVWSKPGISGSNYTLTDTPAVIETLQPGTWYWRVKIEDNYGNQGAWSEPIEFKVLSPIPTWVWVVVGLVVLVVLMVVAYRETKFRVAE